MFFPLWFLAASSALSVVEAGPVGKKSNIRERINGFYALDEVDLLQEDKLKNFDAYLAANPAKSGCTLENAARRLEWGDLTVSQREEYIAAVLCLQSKPPISPRDKYPGALSRYDDFVANHMTFAMQLHSTPHLLPAHRLFIHQYEKALREECGYTGYQPYWNWARYADDPVNSAIFNGNMSSMGGQGLPIEYDGVPSMGFEPPYDMIPPGGGGGCVTEGPFKKMNVSLGPIGTVLPDVPPNPQADGFGSNPRCLRRDVNKYSAAVTKANYTYALITENDDPDKFERVMLGTPENNDWGVHMGGHYTIGGDPGGDFFASPGDPMFWFHHGMIDRIWWIWQMQDPENRMHVVPGSPPADDIVDLAWVAPPTLLSDLLTNIGGNDGDFCYIYD
ncbi:uncharacterized protein BCR38DRAFT_406885 [Pseudomassariella vexata]|uniref:Tyrosinase copper-binding domain-containing protein n=1 Tax=Pseudomassariella vexata TaxID=1141098 RepID=A0A1Y2EBR8_9PEZI|nr:uncharacterized protein BCR38DRAFT_406885 [Pseudomassariella vexata]ORY69010.1 hypothetical protein BCR38DRAFT_406885 [Pseudomassariella vexata]